MPVLRFVLVLTLVLAVSASASVPVVSKASSSKTATAVNHNETTVQPLPAVIDQARAASSPSSRAGEEINWQVLSSGGGIVQVGSLTLGSTIGQSVAGTSVLGSNTLQSGFWQNWTLGPGCCAIRGDVNRSGDVIPDISDLIYLVEFMFQFGPEPPCMEEANVNGEDGDVPDIGDLIHLVDYMFQFGPPVVPCP